LNSRPLRHAASAGPVLCLVLGLSACAGGVGSELVAHPVAVAARDAALETRPSGAAVAWTDAGAGLSGSATVLGTYRRGEQWCRLLREDARAAPDPAISLQSLYCRDPGGGWRRVAAG
jgi:surface antigen